VRQTILSDERQAQGRWDKLIVLLAANNFDGIKLADQHIAERLSLLRPVLYVDPPVSLLSGLKSAAARKALQGPRLRVQAQGLARLTPVVQPFPSRSAMIPLTNLLVRTLIRQAISRLTCDVGAVISAWPMHPVLDGYGERVKVYWAQDDFAGGASLLHMHAGRLAAGEQQTARQADLIIAANPTVADAWRARGYDPFLIPFGVDAAAYSSNAELPRPADVRLPAPIAGFVGHINSRIEITLLEAIASTGMSLLLVGPMSTSIESERWSSLLKRPNVQWIGAKPFEALPAYLQCIDVGIVPYDQSPFNIGSFPLKTLEYLAAGCPVVSTNLPATQWLNTTLVTIADTPAKFTEAVSVCSRRRREQTEVESRRAFASEHDWALRARKMVEVIDHFERANANADSRQPPGEKRSAPQLSQIAS
jgi:glycosyltransferase involved in cell wall biosynthesis